MLAASGFALRGIRLEPRKPEEEGQGLTVRVKPLDHATSQVKLCIAFEPNSQLLQLFGRPASPRNTALAYRSKTKLTATAPSGQAAALNGRLRVAYLAAGRGSWWGRVSSVATDMGLGHFISGKWVALLAAALMAAVAALALRLTLREQP